MILPPKSPVMLRLHLIFAITIVFTAAALSGCRTIDPRATREISILRAEILDLEDEYFSLKAKHRNTVNDLRECKGQPPLADEVYYHPSDDVVYLDGPIIDGSVHCDDGGYYQDEIYLGPTETMHRNGQFLEGTSNGPANGSQPLSNPSPRETIRQPRTGAEEVPKPDPIDQDDGLGFEINIDDGDSTRSSISDFDEGTNLQIEVAQPGVQSVSNSSQIARVLVNRRLSHGQDIDGIPGDDGIVLLIQSLSTTGAVVKQPGKLSISVIDPAERGDDQRIGSWTFSPDEVQAFFVKDELVEQGILLHLPWDLRIPRNSRILVRVLFETLNQQKLETSHELRISTPRSDRPVSEDLIAKWLETDERWADGTSSTPSVASTNDRKPRFRAMPAKSSRPAETPEWRPVR